MGNPENNHVVGTLVKSRDVITRYQLCLSLLYHNHIGSLSIEIGNRCRRSTHLPGTKSPHTCIFARSSKAQTSISPVGGAYR